MNSELKKVLSEYLLGIADDELILGHRDSEWCGHAPILEEDIAFANIALDEIGHASVWYKLAADLIGEDEETYPDQMVFRRDPEDFRNIQLVELPRGDWAFSMLRQYLFDSMEFIRLAATRKSIHKPLAEAAAKIRQEEIYHHRHTSYWIKRLGMGTEESHRRSQNALNELWSFTLQMFQPNEYDEMLQEEQITPDLHDIHDEWTEQVKSYLLACGLTIPVHTGTRFNRKQHTRHLPILITEMQSVARLDMQAIW
jgi:ring-1,2-phenylacetyl-CoA epoxidase subunit PaaC